MKEVLPVDSNRNSDKNAISASVLNRHPATIIYMAFAALAIVIVDYYNPMTGLVVSLSEFRTDNVFDSIIYLLQFILSPAILFKLLIYTPVILVSLVIVFTLVFTGYFYLISKHINDEKGGKKEYFTGLRKYFLKIFSISLISISAFVVFTFFAFMCSIPAIIVNRSFFEGRSELLYPMLFMNLITLFSLFFSFTFLRAYICFWYPSAFNNKSKPLIKAKHTVDERFWRIMGTLILFDLIFIIVKSSLVYAEYFVFKADTYAIIMLLVIEWLFYTWYFSFLTVYVFTAFARYRQYDK